jgi:hypothetical protein
MLAFRWRHVYPPGEWSRTYKIAHSPNAKYIIGEIDRSALLTVTGYKWLLARSTYCCCGWFCCEMDAIQSHTKGCNSWMWSDAVSAVLVAFRRHTHRESCYNDVAYSLILIGECMWEKYQRCYDRADTYIKHTFPWWTQSMNLMTTMYPESTTVCEA